MRNSWSRNLIWGFSAALLLTVLAGCKTSSKEAAVPLTISGTPSAAIDPGQPYRFVPDVAGDDTNSTALNFTIQNKPTWMGFNSATGALSGTPTAAETGIYADILIGVTKGTVSAALPAFSVTVAAADGSSGGGSGGTATLSWTAPTTNSDGTSLTDLAGFRIYYGWSSSAMTNVITISNTQQTSYEVQNLDAGVVWYFVVKAYNSANAESDESPIVHKMT
jgi:Putative Ig domain